jgi:hypothetical protein
MTEAVTARDRVCLITGCGDATRNVHLVPVSELAWFEENSMIEYNRSIHNPSVAKHQIDDPRNGFLCRADVHTAMDTGMFALVPKEGRFVSHFFMASCHLGELYHNTEFRMNWDACVEFLWARLAWTVLKMVGRFAAVRGRKIMLSTGAVVTAGDGKLELSQKRHQEMAAQLRPKSPTKRKAPGESPGKTVNSDESSGFTDADYYD